jgi:hypothetical protein
MIPNIFNATFFGTNDEMVNHLSIGVICFGLGFVVNAVCMTRVFKKRLEAELAKERSDKARVLVKLDEAKAAMEKVGTQLQILDKLQEVVLQRGGQHKFLALPSNQ